MRAWRGMRTLGTPPDIPSIIPSQPYRELRSLQVGVILPVLLFLVAGAADTLNDWISLLSGAHVPLFSERPLVNPLETSKCRNEPFFHPKINFCLRQVKAV